MPDEPLNSAPMQTGHAIIDTGAATGNSAPLRMANARIEKQIPSGIIISMMFRSENWNLPGGFIVHQQMRTESTHRGEMLMSKTSFSSENSRISSSTLTPQLFI